MADREQRVRELTAFLSSQTVLATIEPSAAASIARRLLSGGWEPLTGWSAVDITFTGSEHEPLERVTVSGSVIPARFSVPDGTREIEVRLAGHG